MPERRPDFFVVGHPKSGTTALYDMLRQHPQVFMSPTKEPWYFASDIEVGYRVPPARPRPSLPAYLALFAGAAPGQLCGEATTAYLASETAARDIAAFAPGARVVALFREPAAFVRSFHLELLRRDGGRAEDLRTELAAEPDRPPPSRCTEYVRYTDQLARYHEAFGPDRVLALVYEEYRRANVETLRQVFAFLGVDRGFEVAPWVRNQAGTIRFPRAAAALNRLSTGRGPGAAAGRRAVKAVTTPQARRRALHTLFGRVVTSPPPPVDEELMADLRERFAPEVRKFGDYLGRDLGALWGDAGG